MILVSLQSKVNTICDAVRAVLEKLDVKHYIQSILSTYVRKTPPEYEAALNLLASLRGMLISIIYLIFVKLHIIPILITIRLAQMTILHSLRRRSNLPFFYVMLIGCITLHLGCMISTLSSWSHNNHKRYINWQPEMVVFCMLSTLA